MNTSFTACPTDERRCDSGECVDSNVSFWCDGDYTDCNNGSGERWCRK